MGTVSSEYSYYVTGLFVSTQQKSQESTLNGILVVSLCSLLTPIIQIDKEKPKKQ